MLCYHKKRSTRLQVYPCPSRCCCGSVDDLIDVVSLGEDGGW